MLASSAVAFNLIRWAGVTYLAYLGIRTLWEVLRWRLTVEVEHAPDDFRLNDHLTSRYARLVMEQEPDLVGVFELRELRSR